jgi:hypothetical protein
MSQSGQHRPNSGASAMTATDYCINIGTMIQFWVPTLRLPKGFLGLIEGIRPRHPHVRQISFIESFHFVTRSITVPPFGEYLQVVPTPNVTHTAYNNAKRHHALLRHPAAFLSAICAGGAIGK